MVCRPVFPDQSGPVYGKHHRKFLEGGSFMDARWLLDGIDHPEAAGLLIQANEGLAQLMEGKRVERLLDERTLAALAEGRLGGVGGFYMASLSFVEFLEGQRGQGGLNDLLKAMAETGNVNGAFEKVYRRDVQSLRRDWQARLRQRYGRR